MHKLDGNLILAHGGGNALDRTLTHVVGNKNAGDVCLEQTGITLRRAIQRATAISDQIGTEQAALLPAKA